ncbi:hypothetical protein Tco_0436426 [Tanacetum coccineum]
MITNNNNRTRGRKRGRTLAKLILQGLVRRNLTDDLNLCAQNATITLTVNVLQNVTSATELAIWLVTVGVLQMPTLLTTKRVLGQVRNLLSMNVEPRNISRGIVQSCKTTTVVTKVEIAMLKRNACGRMCKDKPKLKRRYGSQVDITPSTLDHYYDVELVDERIISLDVIIDMDWLAKYQAVIVCAEKNVRIPWGNETLIVRGDEHD